MVFQGDDTAAVVLVGKARVAAGGALHDARSEGAGDSFGGEHYASEYEVEGLGSSEGRLRVAKRGDAAGESEGNCEEYSQENKNRGGRKK